MLLQVQHLPQVRVIMLQTPDDGDDSDGNTVDDRRYVKHHPVELWKSPRQHQ